WPQVPLNSSMPKRVTALSFRITPGRMYSFTFQRSNVLECIISTRARSSRSMCRPIRAVASPLPQTYGQSNFRSENDASAEALAFLLRKDNDVAKKPGTNPKNEFVFLMWSMRMARSAPIGACRPYCCGLEKDEPARGLIIEQGREIAEKSGRPPLSIKNIRRACVKQTAY